MKTPEAKRALFVEAYIENGGHGAKAAITAGYSKKRARITASELLADRNISEQIEKRRAVVIAAAQKKTGLTAEEVMDSLARDIRFDPAKLKNDDGTMKDVKDMDEDTRLALRGMEVDEIAIGRGEDRTVIGHTTKVKFPEKTSAREQGMKHFGLYEADNEQQPPTVHVSGVLTVKFAPFKGRTIRSA